MSISETQLSHRDDQSLAALMERPEYKNRFNDVLGLRAPQFMSSVLSLHMQSMKDVEPKSILAAAMTAASLDLPINPNLGFAYIIAYADKNRGGNKFAQFQMGYKGFIQLAIRTRQYRFLNACQVFEGELVKYDKLSGELVIEEEKKKSDKVVGYASFLRLTNGFEHALYMTAEEVTKHGKQYSQSFKKGYGLWVDNFEAMALKTLVKLLLSKWGVLSVQMERAMYEDQGIKFDMNAETKYVDNVSPIPAAQIADREPPPAADAASETPPDTTTPTATEEKRAEKKEKKKGKKLTVRAEEKASTAAAEITPGKLPGGPHASKLVAALNEAGYLLADFLELAFYQKWLQAPDGYSGDVGDFDLTQIVIPEENVSEFIEPDNFGLILEKLAEQKQVRKSGE